MKKYVLAFVFSNEADGPVLLIEKNKPEWQKGCLNGIGGKIEEGETPLQAMCREWAEETACNNPDAWIPVCKLHNSDFMVYIYTAMIEDSILASMDGDQTDEGTLLAVEWESTGNMGKHITNLEWLIPKSLAMLNAERNCIVDNESVFTEEESQQVSTESNRCTQAQR